MNSTKMNAYKMKHVVVVSKAVKACLWISAFAIALSVNAVYAGNFAINTETRTTPLVVDGSGNWYQTGAGTVTLNAGGSIVIKAPQWHTIIMTAAAGTSTININSGASFDYSGASGGGWSSGGGTNLYIGNANAAAIGIINVNGGSLGGEPLTDIVFGRSAAHGEVNISTGSILFGAAPVFTKGFINFTTSDAGAVGSLRVIGQNETYFQNLYTAGSLRFHGTNTGAFSDHFKVQGDTLIAEIPPRGTVITIR